MPSRADTSAGPGVTFWGAARSVTGSLHRLDACGRSVLLDCGLVQGTAAGAAANGTFPFRAKEIDAVLLSHAHLDHCGALPALVKQGFAGPVHCTPATRALAAVILGDSAKIQEAGPDPLYDGRDVYRTLLRMEAVPYDTPFEVAPGIAATFSDAGHLLGSAIVALRIDAPGGERRLTFTGDLGRPGLPILRDPAPLPACDLLVSECTYGGRTHGSVGDAAERLAAVVRLAADRGGMVLIPAFAVGRTQTVVYHLCRLTAAGRIPDLPIYVDSPMAVRATEVFRAHAECFNDEARRLLATGIDLFGGPRLAYVEKVHESLALNHLTGPRIVVSASGMCEAGRVLHHLQRAVGDARNAILFAGFQAEGTLGRRIVDGAAEVRILGATFAVQAEVVSLDGLSGHADHPEIIRRIEPLLGTARKVRLVHGEPGPAAALADGLRAAGFADVAAPERGERVDFA